MTASKYVTSRLFCSRSYSSCDTKAQLNWVRVPIRVQWIYTADGSQQKRSSCTMLLWFLPSTFGVDSTWQKIIPYDLHSKYNNFRSWNRRQCDVNQQPRLAKLKHFLLGAVLYAKEERPWQTVYLTTLSFSHINDLESLCYYNFAQLPLILAGFEHGSHSKQRITIANFSVSSIDRTVCVLVGWSFSILVSGPEIHG